MDIAHEVPDALAFEPDPAEPLRFLRVCPAYAPAPLREIVHSAGVNVLVKDETDRMGLGAFKALGGVYAVAKLIEARCEAETGRRPRPEELTGPEVREVARSITFVCASAGNHGMAVAAGARIFGAPARIYLSGAVPRGFEKRLRQKDAEVVRAGDTYEESVEAAIADAERTGALLLADGSWPGYTRPPSLVMEGYAVIAEELREAFAQEGEWPTHVYLQAGVGGLAGAIAHMIRETWPVQPCICIVEPESAACLASSQAAGTPVRVNGAESNMGRLDCKEPSIIAHAVLQRCGVEFAAISDEEAAAAARSLEIFGIATTPSGAAGLSAILRSRPRTETGTCFRPLIFVTEGSV